VHDLFNHLFHDFFDHLFDHHRLGRLLRLGNQILLPLAPGARPFRRIRVDPGSPGSAFAGFLIRHELPLNIVRTKLV